MVSSQAGKPLVDRCRVPRHAAQPIRMAEWQVKAEKERPARKPFEDFATIV
jgi:hypothetical protein